MLFMFLVLVSIFVLYFLFALLGPKIKGILGRKICAICAAVSLTWLGLLLFWLFGFMIDSLIIGILMGGSVVGVMYVVEEYFKKNNLRRFWLLRILIITLGFGLVYFLLIKEWFIILLLVFLGLIFLPTAALIAKKDGGKEGGEEIKKKASVDLEKLLEDCC